LRIYFPRKRIFSRKIDGLSIEEFINSIKLEFHTNWIFEFNCYLEIDIVAWGHLHDDDKMEELTTEAYEHVFLARWSHVDKKDKKSTRTLFSCDNSILQVHGCIQREKILFL
jgi:hypothetical protein